MDNNDFDTQINYAFHGFNPDGTPKPITSEAMLFRETFNRVAKGTRFDCLTAWQEGSTVWASIREHEADSIITGVQGCTVASDYEAAARRMIAHCESHDNAPAKDYPPQWKPKG